MVHLEAVTSRNWRTELKIAEWQKGFCPETMEILARAYVFRDYRPQVFLIYEDETPAGMAMYSDCDEEYASYVVDEFFIDERYQGKGLGTQAMGLILDSMREDGKYRRVEICYIEGNTAAQRLYEKMGFRPTGAQEEDAEGKAYILMEQFFD